MQRGMIAALIAIAIAAALVVAAVAKRNTPEAQAVALVHKWEAGLKSGGTGQILWRNPELANWPLAVRSCRILWVNARPIPSHPKSAVVLARIESSNRAGLPITSDWYFNVSDEGDGWKIDLLTPE